MTDRPVYVTRQELLDAWFAKQECFCRHCGAKLPLFPPSAMAAHWLADHKDRLWPWAVQVNEKVVEIWSDGDPVKRSQMLAGFLASMLADRADLYFELLREEIIIPINRWAEG